MPDIDVWKQMWVNCPIAVAMLAEMWMCIQFMKYFLDSQDKRNERMACAIEKQTEAIINTARGGAK